MIYLVSISSKNITDYSDYIKVINQIKEVLTLKDKVIIITSSIKDSSEIELERILKLNINTSKIQIDTLLSLKEIEAASMLSIYLELEDIKHVMLLPCQIPLIVESEIEYVEINNLLLHLSKNQYVIIPGNFGITKQLNPCFYGTDTPELLLCYIYKELIKRRYKVKAHIYKSCNKLTTIDSLNYPTNDLLDYLKLSDLDTYSNTLDKYFQHETIELIKTYKLLLTIGDTFLEGTKISL